MLMLMNHSWRPTSPSPFETYANICGLTLTLTRVCATFLLNLCSSILVHLTAAEAPPDDDMKIADCGVSLPEPAALSACI